jgi:transcriptional regulator with XRE-family HTH domain
MRAHGTRACYVFGPEPGGDRSKGCRCAACRAANNEYALFDQKRRRLDRAEGLFAMPYVSAARAQAHLLRLASKGIGRRRVAELSGVAQSQLSRIRNGEITRVRPATEAKILAVSGARKAAGALVDAGKTWLLIDELLAVGVTKQRIGQALTGRASTRALQLHRSFITQRSADVVAALHLELVLGGPEPKRGTPEHFRWWRKQQARAS